ncbi:single-stranded DNA-binding protein WHY1, chloroplastic-like [Rosa sericea]
MLKLQYSLSSPVAVQNPNHSLSSKARVFSTNSFGFAPNSTSFGKRRLNLKCRQSEYFEQQRLTSPTPPSSAASAAQSPAGATAVPARFYVGHSIYKGKAALTVEPKAPEFTALDSGAFKMSREGFVLLQFAPAAGVRVYDWSRKQVFSLSVTEIGSIVSLGARESCEFFHDPFKGKSEEGKVRKVLKVEPLPDGSGRFFNLSVQNKLINLDENIYIPVTRAEFAVLNSAFNYILPYLIGWHAYANSIKPEDMSRVNNATPRYGGDFEWSR